MQAGKINVVGQLCAAGQVVHTSATDEPDGNAITGGKRLEYVPGVVIQLRSRRIDIEGRERPVEVRQHHQMSSWRTRTDRREDVRHHLGIVVTQPIHATSSARTSTVRAVEP